MSPVRVLVVDDEEALAESIVYALASRADCVVANSGRAAKEILDAPGGEGFVVIFCDLMMPLMNGMELYAALVREKPDMAARMVFMSGGAFTTEATEFMKKIPRDRVIDKPFALKTIREVLQRRLAEAGLSTPTG